MPAPINQSTIDALFREPDEPLYGEDLSAIVLDAKELLGITLTRRQASDIWQKHSDDYCAGWLYYDKQALQRAVDNYIEWRVNPKP